MKILAEYFEKNLKIYKNEKRKIADAIIFFIKNIDSINIFNKKHFYLLLREYTGINSKKITYFLNELKDEYLTIKQQYYNNEM